MVSDQGANSKRGGGFVGNPFADGQPVDSQPADKKLIGENTVGDRAQPIGGAPVGPLTGAHLGQASTDAAAHFQKPSTASLMPEEVRELVSLCLAGDQTAMAALVERFRARVFGLCYRMLGHRQDAEDMAQESFARALRNLASWDAERDFVPWLLAIAGNRCRSQLAVRMRRPRASSEISHLPDLAPDSQAERNLVEEVDLALAQLRPEYRQAFVLFHELQLSYADISVTMDTPVGTIKTWIHRARRELADYLRERGITQESRDAVR